MTLRRIAPLLVASAALLAACDRSSPSHGIYGVVAAAAETDVDWDVADPRAASLSNDTAATAQPLARPVSVGGHASDGLDELDWYRVSLLAGDGVSLAVADAAANLDLCVQDAARVRAAICSLGAAGTEIESVSVAEADEYLVEVRAVAGASSYLLAVGKPAAPSPAALPSDRPFVPGEALVVLRDDAAAARLGALGLAVRRGARGRPGLVVAGNGAAERRRALAALGVRAPLPGTLGAPLDAIEAERLDTLRLVAGLRARPDVESADPNFIHRAAFVPDDEHYGRQWNLPLVALPAAWDLATGATPGGGVVVAVIDTGIFAAHPDLAGQLVPGHDFVRDAARSNDGDGIDPDPDDPGDAAPVRGQVPPGESSFHGTHVAGTVAAATGNGIGVAGVAPGARVMPVRALGVEGGTSSDVMEAVLFAAGLPNASGTLPARRADVVNLSLGCVGCFSRTEQGVFDRVRSAGVIVVAAAGNEGTSELSYPASYAGVISVGAVDIRRARAPYSNRNAEVDVAAPGGSVTTGDANGDGWPDAVLSTGVNDATGTRRPVYELAIGTSTATPHVAGVVALMRAACPSLAPARLDALLASGRVTEDLGAAGRDDDTGHGLLDARRAVVAARDDCGRPLLDVAPRRLDLSPQRTEGTLVASALAVPGAPSLSVTSAVADQPWVTLTPPGGAGLGAWGVTVAPDGLGEGAHVARVTFTASTGATFVATVRFDRPPPEPGDLGHLYVVLLDAAGRRVKQTDVTSASGLYPFALGGVGDGSYTIVAGTDLDGDGLVCDAGEACGAWTPAAPAAALQLAGADVLGITFQVGFDPALAPAALAGAGVPHAP